MARFSAGHLTGSTGSSGGYSCHSSGCRRSGNSRKSAPCEYALTTPMVSDEGQPSGFSRSLTSIQTAETFRVRPQSPKELIELRRPVEVRDVDADRRAVIVALEEFLQRDERARTRVVVNVADLRRSAW